MQDFLIEHHTILYSISYFGAIVFLLFAEDIWPTRRLQFSIRKRWFSNVSLGIINGVLGHWFVPIFSILTAAYLAKFQWGLMPYLDFSYWPTLIISILAYDFMRYASHYLFHRIPLLWRLHRVHHTDLDVDFTTQFRNHPLQIILGVCITLSFVAILSPPPEAVIVNEVLFAGVAFLNHGNWSLPAPVEKVARLLITTPDVHRIHHSTVEKESLSNYGALFTLFDRLFGTFVEQPEKGHHAIELGVKGMLHEEKLELTNMLKDPFSAVGENSNTDDLNSTSK